VARWPRRRKSEKLVALIVLEKRQKQPSTFLQTKKRSCFRKTFFSVLVPEGDSLVPDILWSVEDSESLGYKLGYTVCSVSLLILLPGCIDD